MSLQDIASLGKMLALFLDLFVDSQPFAAFRLGELRQVVQRDRGGHANQAAAGSLTTDSRHDNRLPERIKKNKDSSGCLTRAAPLYRFSLASSCRPARLSEANKGIYKCGPCFPNWLVGENVVSWHAPQNLS